MLAGFLPSAACGSSTKPVVASYQYADEPPLDIPILALIARDDAIVSPTSVAAWPACTTASFTAEILTGGHFAVQGSPEVPALITAVMQQALS